MIRHFVSLTILSAMFASVASAGSAIAGIDCKSASGRTVVTVESEDLGPLNKLVFAIDGESRTYLPLDHQGDAVPGVTGVFKFDYDKKIIEAYATLKSPAAYADFRAIPETVKHKRMNGGFESTFQAVIKGTDPRKNPPSTAAHDGVTVSCKLRYVL